MSKTELESRLQRRCQEIIKQSGAFVFKTHGDIYTRAGMPDLVACVPTDIEALKKMIDEDWFKNNKIGVFVGLEIKRKGELSNLSKAQEIVGREIQEASGLWAAIDDSDLVHALLKKLEGKL